MEYSESNQLIMEAAKEGPAATASQLRFAGRKVRVFFSKTEQASLPLLPPLDKTLSGGI
jgi:hypothetical protein